MVLPTHAPKVSLSWITPEAEDLIVYQARVSNPKSQEEGKNPERLLRYLIKHKHWSPFESASMSVEINTTRDIAAQIIRHRSFSFQEFSQRYADVSELGSIDIPELRFQDQTNRQSSLEAQTEEQKRLVDWYQKEIKEIYQLLEGFYEELLEAGFAKECARKVLPLQSPSRIYMTGNLRSWIHYLQVRMGPETQKEHRAIAQAIACILKEQAPSIYRAALCTESPSPSNKPSGWSSLYQQARSTIGRLSESWQRLGKEGRIWPLV